MNHISLYNTYMHPVSIYGQNVLQARLSNSSTSQAPGPPIPHSFAQASGHTRLGDGRNWLVGPSGHAAVFEHQLGGWATLGAALGALLLWCYVTCVTCTMSETAMQFLFDSQVCGLCKSRAQAPRILSCDLIQEDAFWQIMQRFQPQAWVMWDGIQQEGWVF